MARQPIFGRQENVVGYELLFRSGLENFFSSKDVDMASRAVVDSFLLMGMELLTGGRKAFFNFTRDLLLKDCATVLPHEVAVVEIIETVEPDEEVLSACKRLKRAGYLLALDDYTDPEASNPLTDLADIIKVDFLLTSVQDRKALVSKFRPRGIQMLAEKVETREEFDQAAESGYKYFQGFFFCHPEIISVADIPSFKLNYVRVLRAVNEREMNLDELERAIKCEPALCYRLLRYLNSPVFSFWNQIKSIQHALTLLGEKEIKKWTSLVVLVALGEDRPAELVVASLVRARFCELLAPVVGMRDRKADLFLMGLLSLMDAILRRPMTELLAEMPVSTDIKLALLQGDSRLSDVYGLTLAYEKGDWEKLSDSAARLRLQEAVVPDIYLKSLDWAKQIFQG